MKRNKEILLLSFLIISSNHLSSQDNPKQLYSKPNSLTIAPLNVFDLINPSLQVGYERAFNNKYAFQLEGAYIINHSIENYLIDLANGIKDCPYSNKGFKIRGEIKYFFAKGNFLEPYLSSELFYLKNKSQIMGTFIVSDTTFNYPIPRIPGYDYYQDFYTVERQRFGLNMKIGLKLFISDDFFMESYFGIGLAYQICYHFDRDNLNDESIGGLLDLPNKLGEIWTPNIPINIKLGYRF